MKLESETEEARELLKGKGVPHPEGCGMMGRKDAPAFRLGCRFHP